MSMFRTSRELARNPLLALRGPVPRIEVRLDRRVLALVMVALVLYLPGITWGLPSEFPMATNAEAPYDSLLFVGNYTNANQVTKYPDVSRLLALVPYAVIFAIEKATGGLQTLSATWPYGFTDPFATFSALLLVRNAMSLCMGIGVLITLLKLQLPALAGPPAWLAVALFGSGGVFVYYARVPTEDLPNLFWWALSLVALTRYLAAPEQGKQSLLMASVCSALAIGSKDQAAGLVLGSGVLVLVLGAPSARMARLPWRLSRLAVPDAAQFSVAMLAAYFVVAVLPQPFRWVNHIKTWLPAARNVRDYVMFPNTLQGHLGLFGATFHALVDDLSLGALLLAAVGLGVLVWQRRWHELLILTVPALAYYLMIIAPIRFVYERFMLPVAYLAALAAGVAVWTLFEAIRARRPGLAWLAPGAAAGSVAYQLVTGYGPITASQLLDTKVQLARQAPTTMPPGSAVLFISTEAMRGLPNADFYRNYRMMVPPDIPTPPRFQHVFQPYDPTYQFILTIEPLEDGRSDVRLVHTITLPPEIADRAAVPLKQDYYIYQRL